MDIILMLLNLLQLKQYVDPFVATASTKIVNFFFHGQL